MKKIAVIFTCFNRREKTIKCINSLVNGNQNIDFSFIIVDDNSNDGTVKAIEKLQKNIKILIGNGNLYWAGGMRKGIEYCQQLNENFNYVLYVNDDVDFFSGSIEKMVTQEANKSSVIVGATCDSKGDLTYGALKFNRKGIYFQVPTSFKEPCETFNMNCVLVPIKIFNQMGNLDRYYTHALADLDYGLRISRSNYKIFISEDYVGVCEVNTIKNTWKDISLNRIERLKKKESIKGSPFKPWFYYLRKNFGLVFAIKHSISPFLRIILRK